MPKARLSMRKIEAIVNGGSALRLATRNRPLPVEASASPDELIIQYGRQTAQCRMSNVQWAMTNTFTFSSARLFITAIDHGLTDSPFCIWKRTDPCVNPDTSIHMNCSERFA